MKKIVVIGGGVAGLATAAMLAKDGYEVELFEKNKELGGRGRVWEKGGYRFDMGPSWYMMPEIFDKFMDKMGKRLIDYYDLLRLPVHYRVFFDGGRKYDIRKKKNKNAELFERTERGAGKKLEEYLDSAREVYEKSMEELVYMDYDDWRSMLKPELIPYLVKFNFFETFHNYVAKFFKNKDLQKIIEFTTVFLGGSPYNTPAFYRLISHTDFNLGIWYPKGGMGKIFEMLEKVAREEGVKIHSSAEVEEIMVDDGRAVGVKVGGKKVAAEVVVSGADYWWTETKLLRKKWRSLDDAYWKKAILSPSALVIYLGIKGRIKNLEHHNLYFSDSWEKGFEDVYKSGKWPNNPSYYVHVPSVSDRSVCPENGESMMILIPVAAGLNDSDEIRKEMAEKTINHLEKISGEKIKERTEVMRIFSQRDFKGEYHALGGAAFGLAHTLRQTAIFRPKNRSKKVRNLFYAGQYTNPGVGVPVGIISAMIVEKMIRRDEQK